MAVRHRSKVEEDRGVTTKRQQSFTAIPHQHLLFIIRQMKNVYQSLNIPGRFVILLTFLFSLSLFLSLACYLFRTVSRSRPKTFAVSYYGVDPPLLCILLIDWHRSISRIVKSTCRFRVPYQVFPLRFTWQDRFLRTVLPRDFLSQPCEVSWFFIRSLSTELATSTVG